MTNALYQIITVPHQGKPSHWLPMTEKQIIELAQEEGFDEWVENTSAHEYYDADNLTFQDALDFFSYDVQSLTIEEIEI